MISDEEANNLDRVANEIKTMVQGLRDDMQRAESIRDDLAKLMRSGRVTRLIVTAVSIVLGLVLVLGAIQAVTISKLNNVVAVQHDSALCPLYQLFINSDTPTARAAAEKRGDDMALRDRSFLTIRQSYAALNCNTK